MLVPRPRLALLLILAFLATFFAPIRAGWSCPDGTACVAGGGDSFVCVGGQCASEMSCCEVERTVRCKHGALPGSGRPSTQPGVEVPDHCRFSASVSPPLVAVTGYAGSLLDLTFVALPAFIGVEIAIPAAAPTWRAEHTLGYRPPPVLSTGPSRAPPVA